ncbi:MAG: electron transporter RnfB [Erysipelotrichaceae bacterium]|nr:electron transporter RnfB [Erysipelotrichaceae bacterium]
MLSSILSMLVIGAILGLILGIASSLFYVKVDNRVQDVIALLPGYNCGGCGYPGCAGLAEALVNENVSVNLCKPSKPDQKETINQYLQTHKEA